MTTRPARLAAELALLAAAAAAVAFLTLAGTGHAPAAAPSAPAAAAAGPPPAPPPGAFVVAQEDGPWGVALSGRVEGSTLGLTATVLSQNGLGVNGLDVSFAVDDGSPSAGDSCGSGCYAASTATHGRPAAVTIVLSGGARPASSVRFDLPELWPPRPAAQLVAHATRTFEQLRSLVTHERLGSDATHVLHTTYRDVAPDRLAYTVRGVGSSVIVGAHRWDRQHGGPWKRSPQSPIRVPAPTWGRSTKVTNAFLLGRSTVAGRPVWVVSFATPSVPAWFTIWLDRQTGRTLQLRMTAAAHFMHHRYTGFDRPLAIRPPG